MSRPADNPVGHFQVILTVIAVDLYFFFFNDTATTEIYTLSLHDALPIYSVGECAHRPQLRRTWHFLLGRWPQAQRKIRVGRSEEHTSELQSLAYLVCRLLLEKKKRKDGAAGVNDTTLRLVASDDDDQRAS